MTPQQMLYFQYILCFFVLLSSNNKPTVYIYVRLYPLIFENTISYF